VQHQEDSASVHYLKAIPPMHVHCLEAIPPVRVHWLEA